MKNLTLILLITINVLLFTIHALSQSCLPEGITFTTQAQIDNFQTNYPSCYEIEGNVIITGEGIVNLIGLNILTSVSGLLEISNADNLTSLSGLQNLNTISNIFYDGGRLHIINNDALINLNGLEGLTKLGFGFNSISGISIEDNEVLYNLYGIENIQANTIEDLFIENNPSLSICGIQSICDYLVSPGGSISISVNALGCNSQEEIEESCSFCLPDGITFTTQAQIDNFFINYPDCKVIEGNVEIYGENITNLNGLSLLTAIGGNFLIGDSFNSNNGNPNLNNLDGLNNLTLIGGDFEVNRNDILLDLEGLDNLNSIIGSFKVVANDALINLTGLNNLTSIGGDLWFHANNALTNLTGLENLISVTGSVEFGGYWPFGNNSLQSLTGINNLNYIGGSLNISDNHVLQSLTGLESLTHVGDLNIGNCLAKTPNHLKGGNSSLKNLTGLDNLTYILGNLSINCNDSLTSLAGLENIEAYYISSLYIDHNSSLSTCDVESICDYLAISNSNIDIHDNATGCNSQEEVEEACAQSVDEISAIYNLSIHPNPFSNTITIEFELRQPETITITLYNYLGIKVEVILESKSVGQQKIDWDCEGLAAGIYFCVLKTKEGILTKKIIKTN